MEAKRQAKQRYLEQVEQEINRKRDLEQKIKELEQRESELIGSLQMCNEMETKAFDGLKKIITGGELEDEERDLIQRVSQPKPQPKN